MSRILLRKLVLRNFRSFVGDHEIIFPESGLVRISGTNHDTGGDSGAGKSTVLLAIAYLLGYAPYSAKDMQSCFTDDPMQVEGHFDTADGPAVLKRGAKLSLKVGDETVKGSAKAVEERLDRLMGVGADLRKALTYRGQGERGMFLTMSDPEKKEFLVQVLGIHWLETEIKRVSDALPEFQGRVELAQKTLDGYTAGLTMLEQNPVYPRQEPVGDHVTSLDAVNMAIFDGQAVLLQLETQRQTARAAYQDALANVAHDRQRQIEDCVARRQRVEKADQEALAAHRARLAEWNHYLQRAKVKAAQRDHLVRERLRLGEEIQKLNDRLCFTCGRTWVESESSERRSQAVAEVFQIEERLTEVRQAEKNVAELEETIRSMREPQPDHKIVQFNEIEHNLRTSLEQKRREIDADWGFKDEKANNEWTVASMAFARLEGKKTSLEAQILMIQRQNRENLQANEAWLAKVEVQKKSVAAAGAEVAKCHVALNTELDYLDMLKGFRNKYFDETLADIASHANDIMVKIPNVAHVSMRFVSDYETQKGTVKQKITPVAYFNGSERPIVAGSSGGMYTSIQLATDLGVVQVVGAKTGTNLSWLILDEAFEGHGKVEKEGCLQVLSRYATDKLIVVIDHASEFKEEFSKVITIEYRDGRSWVS